MSRLGLTIHTGKKLTNKKKGQRTKKGRKRKGKNPLVVSHGFKLTRPAGEQKESPTEEGRRKGERVQRKEHTLLVFQ